MSNPAVVMMSLWRNDAGRKIRERAYHLLDKSYPNLRYVWVVGDSQDRTVDLLHDISWKQHKEVQFVKANTGIEGEEVHIHRKRLSLSANFGFATVRAEDEFWVIHESDLITPVNIVELFLATGKCPVGGWPTLTSGGRTIFYDTWSYRKDGVKFINDPPYHACFRAGEIFEVDSVGSCWMFYAQDLRSGVRCFDEGCVELCAKFKKLGRMIWVDQRIPVVQPEDMWIPAPHD